jgi:PAS domain S-box-containing protein
MHHDGASSNANEERELYDILVHHVEDFAIFLLDGNGCIATWNSGAEKIFGYTSADIIGQPLARLYTEEDISRSAPDQELRDAKAMGKASDDRWLVRKDHTRIWVSGVTVALRGEESQRFGKIVRDQTDMRQNTERLVKLNQALVSSVQNLEQAQQELKEKVLEMEQFEEVVIGRELKMRELEKQVKELRKSMESRTEDSNR